ncbi:LOW QUALITY PROTEIN: hypothetical protein QTO34_005540, partial [Cnephaeus nilssonii]
MEPKQEPGNQAAHSITAPSHLTRIKTLGRTPCFRVVSPCAEDRGLKRGSDESIFRRARRWIRTQSRRRLGPFARRERESSTCVKKEQQLLEESPCDMGPGPVSHTTEGQDRPEVRVATWASGEPGPVDGQPGTPPRQPPRLFWPPTPKPTRFHRPPTPKHPWFHRQRKVFTRDLDYGAHVNRLARSTWNPKEAEPKGEKLGNMDMQALGDLFSSPNSSTSPGGRGGSSCHTKVHPEDRNAELEAPPPPELSPPPAASPAAAVEPGPAPEETEAPAPLDEEPSLEPMLAPASEEELPVEGPAQGPLLNRGGKGSRHCCCAQKLGSQLASTAVVAGASPAFE